MDNQWMKNVGLHPDGSLYLSQVEGEVRQRQLEVAEQEQNLHVTGRTVELLPDAENNMAKLQVMGLAGELGWKWKIAFLLPKSWESKYESP